MDADDVPVGHLLSRRHALALLGLSGAATALGCARDASTTTDREVAPPVSVGPCVVRPVQTLGPYFVEEDLNRSDVRTDPATGIARAGTPLTLAFTVSQLRGTSCALLPNAQVDIWHCDAAGAYSDVNDPGFNTRGQKWLRGWQRTDAAGAARFTTIFPGWYSGRAVHIHFRIRATVNARGYDFVSQLYFSDALIDRIHAQAPYAARGTRNVRNARDGLFAQGGSQLTLDATEGPGGVSAALGVALQVT